MKIVNSGVSRRLLFEIKKRWGKYFTDVGNSLKEDDWEKLDSFGLPYFVRIDQLEEGLQETGELKKEKKGEEPQCTNASIVDADQ